MEAVNEFIREIPTELIRWYPFNPSSRILYLGNESDAMAQAMHEAGALVCAVPLRVCDTASFAAQNKNTFNYIVSVADLEKTRGPSELLVRWRTMLSKDGHLLLGLHNRIGIRYLCGDPDPYTDGVLDSIDGYRHRMDWGKDSFSGRMYSRGELERLLADAEFHMKFYAVYPSLSEPALLYADSYLPNEDINNRIFPHCCRPDLVFLSERSMYRQLLQEGGFHRLANAFFIDCTVQPSDFFNAVQITSFLERGRKNAMITILMGNGTVEKRAAYSEGAGKIRRLAENMTDLATHGLPIVPGKIEGNVYRMPFVKAENGQVYLEHLMRTDHEECLKALDQFRDMILQSSEHVETDEREGVILRKGYWDLVPWNTFYQDGKFIVYDQEHCTENLPANLIIFRMLHCLDPVCMDTRQVIPREQLMARYGLAQDLQHWIDLENHILEGLRHDEELTSYSQRNQISDQTLQQNRFRMNFSAAKYTNVFFDIFGNLGSRKIILFGSGKFARSFIDYYRHRVPIAFIVDNNKANWGKKLLGLEIHPPEELQNLDSEKYKVMICIKDYLPIIHQLRSLRVRDYAVFDKSKLYPGVLQLHFPERSQDGTAKPYHIGYVAGVFDLYHVGHLNLFRRAKEYCDYLIVGMCSDEWVRTNKHKEPFVPFNERIELVKSCRYVDEVVPLPLGRESIRDAWRMIGFDVQFSGDDHVNNEAWLADQAYLRAHGSDVMFVPYTRETSSTQLQALIRRKLL